MYKQHNKLQKQMLNNGSLVIFELNVKQMPQQRRSSYKHKGMREWKKRCSDNWQNYGDEMDKFSTPDVL